MTNISGRRQPRRPKPNAPMSYDAAQTPEFDPAAIERLRAVAGDQSSAFVAEMAELFLGETRKTLTDLRAASDKEDWKVVARLAHSLKSSAATLGAMRLSAVCRSLELDVTDGAAGARTRDLVASVLKHFDEAAPTLQSLK